MTDLALKEKEILAGLKDFQLATVNRVSHLFTSDFHRVLVADEVGLGKTLVARGVIAKMARHYKEDMKREIFKVVYVCSNQSIAGQSLQKLKVYAGKVDGLSDTRLSMQHLKIYQQLFESQKNNDIIHLIPLTPGTSFSMTAGCGSVLERALIYAILRRVPFFQPYLNHLEELMISYATVSWKYYALYFEKEVTACDQNSSGAYLADVLEKVNEHLNADPNVCELAKKVFASIKDIGYRDTPNANYLILRFRKIMAEISVEMLDADLVIMDEFQRFPELINVHADSETAILARQFFSPQNGQEHMPRILLLSATPYKLYSTMEEIQENRRDEHYKEFMQVMNFLFEHRPDQSASFVTAWKNYSIALNEVTFNDTAMILIRKKKAEDILYNGICRTERMKVPGVTELIDTDIKSSTLSVHEDDILSYVETDRVMEQLELRGIAPVEYIKSAPLVMSFMQHYKLKQKISDRMKQEPNRLSLLKSPRLWVNRNKVAKYKPLKVNHARFNKLQEIALPPKAEKLLWIPPSRPYYEPGGPFQNQQSFSKTLVFSAWEMVPRAIAALLSYEAECLTVGKLVHQTPNTGKENRSYFAKNRFPAPRIKFAIKNNMPDNMNFLCLLYPSITLESLFNPISAMNRNLSIPCRNLLLTIEELKRSLYSGLISAIFQK